MIRITNLHKRFNTGTPNEVYALRGIDLHIKEGCHLSIGEVLLGRQLCSVSCAHPGRRSGNDCRVQKVAPRQRSAPRRAASRSTRLAVRRRSSAAANHAGVHCSSVRRRAQEPYLRARQAAARDHRESIWPSSPPMFYQNQHHPAAIDS